MSYTNEEGTKLLDVEGGQQLIPEEAETRQAPTAWQRYGKRGAVIAALVGCVALIGLGSKIAQGQGSSPLTTASSSDAIGLNWAHPVEPVPVTPPPAAPVPVTPPPAAPVPVTAAPYPTTGYATTGHPQTTMWGGYTTSNVHPTTMPSQWNYATTATFPSRVAPVAPVAPVATAAPVATTGWPTTTNGWNLATTTNTYYNGPEDCIKPWWTLGLAGCDDQTTSTYHAVGPTVLPPGGEHVSTFSPYTATTYQYTTTTAKPWWKPF